MSQRIRFLFPSLIPGNEYAYLVTSDALELMSIARGGRPVAYWAGSYQTYGDGLVQHAPTFAVQMDCMGDYLASLAAYLTDAATPNAENALYTVAAHWPEPPSRQTVMFLAGIRYKEGKRVYYSKGERKTSTAESKQYDKRWLPVEDWANGSPEAVYRMLAIQGREYSSMIALEHFIAYKFVKDTISEEGGHWGKQPHEWIGSDDHYLESAVNAVGSLVQSLKYKEWASRSLNSYRENTDARRRAEADRVEAQKAALAAQKAV